MGQNEKGPIPLISNTVSDVKQMLISTSPELMRNVNVKRLEMCLFLDAALGKLQNVSNIYIYMFIKGHRRQTTFF